MEFTFACRTLRSSLGLKPGVVHRSDFVASKSRSDCLLYMAEAPRVCPLSCCFHLQTRIDSPFVSRQLLIPFPQLYLSFQLAPMTAMATSLVDNQTAAISESPLPHKRPSCMVCHRRKVKCDGKGPCSRCVKDGADCRVDRHKRVRPGTRRIGSPGSSTPGLALRLQQYERLLRAHGIDLDGRVSDHEDDLMEDTDAASGKQKVVQTVNQST